MARKRLTAAAAWTGRRPTGGADAAAAGEGGFSLVEVVIALTVLMVVLLPVANLLTTTDSVISGSQFRGEAQRLADGDIQQLQAMATADPNVLPPYTTANLVGDPLPIALPGAGPSWPSALSSDPTATVTVGHEQFGEYVVGDWCGTTSSPPVSWAAVTAGPTAFVFVVAVKVVWGPNPTPTASGGTSIVEYGALPQQVGWRGVPTAYAQTDGCPTGLS